MENLWVTVHISVCTADLQAEIRIRAPQSIRHNLAVSFHRHAPNFYIQNNT